MRKLLSFVIFWVESTIEDQIRGWYNLTSGWTHDRPTDVTELLTKLRVEKVTLKVAAPCGEAITVQVPVQLHEQRISAEGISLYIPKIRVMDAIREQIPGGYVDLVDLVHMEFTNPFDRKGLKVWANCEQSFCVTGW